MVKSAKEANEGKSVLTFIVHLKLNEHLLENLSVWEWNGTFRNECQGFGVFRNLNCEIGLTNFFFLSFLTT